LKKKRTISTRSFAHHLVQGDKLEKEIGLLHPTVKNGKGVHVQRGLMISPCKKVLGNSLAKEGEKPTGKV